MARKVLKRGDIILVPFPFTDQSGAKARPAIIVSEDPQKLDLIIAFISSIIPAGKPDKTDLVIPLDHPAFPETGLLRPSVFKMSRLMTIDRGLILRRLGRVSPELQAALDQRLRAALGLS